MTRYGKAGGRVPWTSGPALLIRFRAGDRRWPRKRRNPRHADVHAAPDLAVPLRAGPLRLVFDRGELRWIRLGEREVLRGLYVAVREEGWATVPAELEDLEIEAEPEAFRIRFRGPPPPRGRPLRLGGAHPGRHRRPHHLHDGRRRGVDLPAQPHRLLRAPPGRGLRRPPLHRRDRGRRPGLLRLPQPRRAAPAVPQRPRDPPRGDARRRGRGADGGGDLRDRGPAQLVRRVVQDLRDAAAPPVPGRGGRGDAPRAVRDRAAVRRDQRAGAGGRRHRARRPPEEAQQHGAGDRARRGGRAASRGRPWGSAAPASGRSGPRTPSACDRSGSTTCGPTCASRRRAGRPASSGRSPTPERSRRPSSWPSSCRTTRGRSCGSSRAARPRCGRASPAGCSSASDGTTRRRRRRPRAGGARPGLARGPLRWRDGRPLRRAEPAAALAPRARPARLRAPSPGPRLRRGHDGREPRQPPLDGGHGAGASRAGSPSGSRPSRCARARTRARPPRAPRGSRRSPTTRGRRRRSRRPGRSASSPPPPRPDSKR